METPPRIKVLFLSQDASRTGAPIQLLHLLRWLKAEAALDAHVLVLRGGEMLDEFRQVCPTTKGHFPGMGTLLRLLRNGPVSRGIKALLRAAVRFRLKRLGVDVIYNNSVVNGWALDLFGTGGLPVITHVHELRYSTQIYLGSAAYDPIRRHTDCYLAVSDAVRRELVEEIGIPPERIDLLRGFIPDLPNVAGQGGGSAKAFASLGISPGAKVVVGCGRVAFPKGPDLFVLLACTLSRRRPDEVIQFIWVGESMPGGIGTALVQDSRKLGLEGRLHFVGASPRPWDYFAAADVFVLPSRDESMSLVVLEAAREGVPAVCFDKTGGPSEFVEDDCGFVVPYLDVSAMADAVSKLLDSPALRNQMGQRARAKVRERHHVNVGGPQAVAAVRRCAAGAGPRAAGGQP